MTEVMPRCLAEDAFRNADAEGDGRLVNDYIGRGMYGEKCFGLVGPDRLWAAFLASLTELEISGSEDGEAEWANLLTGKVVTDSMGRRTIFYFPGILLSES